MNELIPEASPETLKYFASSSKFKVLLDAIVDDNVATVEDGEDLVALKRELELEAHATIPLTDIIGQQEVDNCYNSVLLTYSPIADDQKTAAEVLGNKARVRFWIVKQGLNSADIHDEVTIQLLGNAELLQGVQTSFRMHMRARKSRSNVDVAALRVVTKAGAAVINADLRRFMPSNAVLWAQVEGSDIAVPANARTAMDRVRPQTPANVTPQLRRSSNEAGGGRSRTSRGARQEEGECDAHDPSNAIDVDSAKPEINLLNPQIALLVAQQVRLALADRDRESDFSGDRELSFHQSDKQAGEAARLRAVQGIFMEEKFSDKFGDGSHINRLEGFASRFIAFIAMRMFYLDRNWSTNAAKHFVCCDWTIGGSSASVGLHLFTPMGRINEVGDFVTACANWAECEAWLRGDHMRLHINALCMRLVHLSCDEPQIGGRELATAIEVLAMNLRQPCESQGGTTPMLRVQNAMPIPSVSVDENRTLARFIRRNVSHTAQREHQRGDSTHRGQHNGQHQQSAKPQQGGRGASTGKRVRDRTPPPAMAGAPKQQMCYEWVAKNEPAVCPSRRGTGCKWDHSWGTATEADKAMVRAHATRPRDGQT
jgi:hypothetical protein